MSDRKRYTKRVEELCLEGKPKEALSIMEYWKDNWEAPFYLSMWLTFWVFSISMFISTLDFVSIDEFTFSPIFLLLSIGFTYPTIKSSIWTWKFFSWMQKNKIKYV